MSIDDFEVIKPISRGAFGRVYLARKKATGDPFAIKVCSSCETLTPNPPLVMCASLSADDTLACNRPLVFIKTCWFLSWPRLVQAFPTRT